MIHTFHKEKFLFSKENFNFFVVSFVKTIFKMGQSVYTRK